MEIIINKFSNSHVREVARVIHETYACFNKNEGSEKAIQSYLSLYSPNREGKELLELFSKTPIFFVAIKENKIIGLIRGTKSQIVNLFVLGKYHKNGIGEKLLEKFEKEAILQKSKKIKIRASLYATDFYQKRGYKKTTGLRTFKGLKIQPMQKRFGKD